MSCYSSMNEYKKQFSFTIFFWTRHGEEGLVIFIIIPRDKYRSNACHWLYEILYLYCTFSLYILCRKYCCFSSTDYIKTAAKSVRNSIWFFMTNWSTFCHSLSCWKGITHSHFWIDCSFHCIHYYNKIQSFQTCKIKQHDYSPKMDYWVISMKCKPMLIS